MNIRSLRASQDNGNGYDYSSAPATQPTYYDSNYYSNNYYDPYASTMYSYSPYADRAPTGIQYLDTYILQGGLKKGEVYLVAGEAGMGKTIFSLQFLKTGADMGETGIYITVDEPSEDVKRGVQDALGWNLEPYEQQNKLIMHDFRTHFRLYANDDKLSIDPKNIAKILVETVRKYNAQRVVIDPIAPLLITSHQDVLWIREYMRELVFNLKKLKDVTTLITSEIPTGETTKISRFGVEEYLASGVIIMHLYEDERTHEIYRVMYIRKMRWMKVQPIKLAFDIYEPYGILIRGKLSQVLAAQYQPQYQYEQSY
jgi:circadian clock protein KaiC